MQDGDTILFGCIALVYPLKRKFVKTDTIMCWTVQKDASLSNFATTIDWKLRTSDSLSTSDRILNLFWVVKVESTKADIADIQHL